jgi:integrase
MEHKHDYQEEGNYYVCSCGKRKLKLVKDKEKDISYGRMDNGKIYVVRNNRDRFFYPFEWVKFFDNLKPSQKMTFEFLMNTGARINEARNVKVQDIDLINNRLILRVTKVKAKKGESNPRPRTISISSQFAKRLKKYINDNKLKNEDYIGILSTPATTIAMKKTLREIGIKDWYMLSIHNIRKTHGNYLKALGITQESEICKRLGHDYNTFLKSYASSDIFTLKDKQDMRLIIGDLYQR